MRIQEIYLESLDNPLPYDKISNGIWQIGQDIILRIETFQVQSYNISHISFNIYNPQNSKPELSGNFSGGGATRVFASIIEIIKSYPQQDMLLFLPDDIKTEVAGKKARLYKVILRRLMASNLIIRLEEFPQATGEHLIVALPSGSKLWNVANSEIEALVVEYMIQKTS